MTDLTMEACQTCGFVGPHTMNQCAVRLGQFYLVIHRQMGVGSHENAEKIRAAIRRLEGDE